MHHALDHKQHHGPANDQRRGGAGGHERHAGDTVGMFRDRFWITLVFAISTLVWDPIVQDWLGYSAAAFPGSVYVPAVFGSIVYLHGGWVFLKGAAKELRDRLPGMMTLIGLAISVAFLYSAAVTLGLPGHPLWWELATLVMIMLLGHWIEMRSVSRRAQPAPGPPISVCVLRHRET